MGEVSMPESLTERAESENLTGLRLEKSCSA